MINIIKTEINLGLNAPVNILHITDTHIATFNQKDSEEIKNLMIERRKFYKELASFPKYSPEEYFIKAIEYAKENDCLLIVGGDTIDIYSSGNMEKFQQIIAGQDMMMTLGGHDQQKRLVKTMLEEYPYFLEIRKILEKDFPNIDLEVSSRIINGINIVCVDNSLDYFSKSTYEKFKKELEKGLPIIVFMHDPIWMETLYFDKPYHENIKLSKEDYEISHKMIDLIKHHPLIITTFSGHYHRNEQREIDGKIHYETSALFKGDARLIQIK